jgi:hypothetical protein
MQIATIHKLQYALDTVITVLKFSWRHALTLIVVGMIVAALIIGEISWVNSFHCFIGAVFCDWLKMQIKFSNARGGNGNLAMEQMFESSRWNRPTPMLPTWNAYDPGSAAYNLRQSTNY